MQQRPYVLPTIGQVTLDLWPLSALITAIFWGLVEMIVAELAGGWFYREQDQAA